MFTVSRRLSDGIHIFLMYLILTKFLEYSIVREINGPVFRKSLAQTIAILLDFSLFWPFPLSLARVTETLWRGLCQEITLKIFRWYEKLELSIAGFKLNLTQNGYKFPLEACMVITPALPGTW